MDVMVSQITSVSIVYSIVCSDEDQRNHHSSASLAFTRGIHRWPVNSPHKGPETRQMFPFDDVIMFRRITSITTVSWVLSVGKLLHTVDSVTQKDSSWHPIIMPCSLSNYLHPHYRNILDDLLIKRYIRHAKGHGAAGPSIYDIGHKTVKWCEMIIAYRLPTRLAAIFVSHHKHVSHIPSI